MSSFSTVSSSISSSSSRLPLSSRSSPSMIHYSNYTRYVSPKRIHLFFSVLVCVTIFNILLPPIKISIQFDTGAASTQQSKYEFDNNPTIRTNKKQQREQQLNTEYEHNNENDDDNNADHFSACVNWKEGDNKRLEEWLAYHYYVLKLRNVVIGIAPNSHGGASSPNKVMDRWNNAPELDSSFHITAWEESVYHNNASPPTPADTDTPPSESANNTDTDTDTSDNIMIQEMQRQQAFYRHCTKHLKALNKTWVSYINTDEYLSLRRNNDDDENENGDLVENYHSKSIMFQPNYLFHRFHSIKQQATDENISCVTMKRKRYCSKELNTKDKQQLMASSYIPNHLFEVEKKDHEELHLMMMQQQMIDGTTHIGINDYYQLDTIYAENMYQRFMTLRYKYQQNPRTRTPEYYIEDEFDLPKTIMDLSSIDTSIETETNWNQYTVMGNFCRNETRTRTSRISKMIQHEQFVLNRYRGSWESLARNENSGGRNNNTNSSSSSLLSSSAEEWLLEQSRVTNGDYSIIHRGWLKGFTKLVGSVKVAAYLLQDAGKYKMNNKNNDNNKSEKRKTWFLFNKLT